MKFRKEAYLKHQWEFLTNKSKIKALVSGYGGGKTYIFLRETLKNHLSNKCTDTGKSRGWVIYPTYSLADELFIEPFLEMLSRLNIVYDFHKQGRIIETRYGSIRVYQLQRPDNIIGSNLSYVGFDEFDIESTEKSLSAYRKALGRLRGSKETRLYIVTTPEGFKATYNIFKEHDQESKCLIQAKTTDNPHLPEGYIQTLREEYDEQLLECYLNGKFVNLNSGNVYYGFKREKNIKEVSYEKGLPLNLCVDFNVTPMLWELVQYRSREDIRVIKEIARKNTNTQEMCLSTMDWIANNIGNIGDIDLTVYGDASGTSRDTRSFVSDYGIIEQNMKGFRSLNFKIPVKNPPVRYRTNLMNAKLSKGYLNISADCKNLIEDFERIVFDKRGDIDKSNMDLTHASDALGYMICQEFPFIKPKKTTIRSF